MTDRYSPRTPRDGPLDKPARGDGKRVLRSRGFLSHGGAARDAGTNGEVGSDGEAKAGGSPSTRSRGMRLHETTSERQPRGLDAPKVPLPYGSDEQ